VEPFSSTYSLPLSTCYNAWDYDGDVMLWAGPTGSSTCHLPPPQPPFTWVSLGRQITLFGLHLKSNSMTLGCTGRDSSGRSSRRKYTPRKRKFLIHAVQFRHWLTNQLTPWSWALLEKPTVSSLLKKFSTSYGTRRFITVFTRTLLWYLSWASPVRTTPSYLSKIHFNIIHSPTSRSS
jgi:hypothetical protein